MDEDSGEVLDLWHKRRGPGYVAVVVVSVLVSALVVGGAQVALARWPRLQTLLGAKPDPDRGKVVVPGITKIPLQSAADLLGAHGLSMLSIGSASDPEIPPGWVVTQAPEAGQKVRRGRTVHVKLSGGPPLVPVPAVVGTGLLEAQRLLLGAGLRVGSVETAGAALRVSGSRPQPGEQAASGAPITLILEVVPPTDADAGVPEEAAGGRRRRR